ncbi:putative membrane protein YrzS [Heyndrickxia sporothermodurans]|nr:putative membrane protein YrzS [Heyndrickxia sporothermodurans]
MNGIAKVLMLMGGFIFIIGFLMQFIKIGKLPGDIFIKKGNATFYFPVMTSILVSVLLSIIFYLINRLK